MTEAPAPSRPSVTVGPGRSVRFAVLADDGRRSMAWTVWTSKRTLDAYLTVRPLSGRWKFSLHQSGSWQSGVTREWASAVDLASRHLDRWQRPDEFAPGMRRSVQVVVPDAELRQWPAGVTDDKPPMVAVPAPGVGHAACIEFVFMAGRPPMLLEFQEPVFDVAALVLCDGSAVRVVSRQAAWTKADDDWLVVHKKALLATADPEMLFTLRAPRGLLAGHHEDGSRFVVDVAGDLD
jgi:hypothetical protein